MPTNETQLKSVPNIGRGPHHVKAQSLRSVRRASSCCLTAKGKRFQNQSGVAYDVPAKPEEPVVTDEPVVTVTIKDVARLAGVSPASVSRALADPGQVRPGTRERVHRAAAALGYHPNQAARALTTGRTRTIGLVVPDITNPIFSSIFQAVQGRARESGYSVLLADTGEDPATEVDLVRTLAQQVDGFLLCSPRATQEDLDPFLRTTAVVTINHRGRQVPCVTSDNTDGARQAAEHLLALGHRRLAYVAGPAASSDNRERLRGLRTTVAAAGAELTDFTAVSPTYDGGTAAADLVLATSATAVIAFNDVIALGLLNRFTARGIEVPQQISLVGFDDIPFAAMTNPPLTSVAVAKQQIGRT
ncbi:MAG: LacI family DNA-binding transcriptional regulator, partial [Catenulispora sp.]|nr:LacI family DNA-binding transcriptional regulator [Catenulispora sp.]